MAPITKYVLAEYIWIDAFGELRGKTKCIHGKSEVTLKDLPKWNYDGSSTGQAPGEDSEVVIVPRAIYHDPFRGGNHILVMTDTYDTKGNPLPTNTRAPAAAIFDAKLDEEPWFGLEQEYTLFKDGVPLGWPISAARAYHGATPTIKMGYPGPQGPYYCSAGADVAFGRPIVEQHLQYCMSAGINISGINAEVLPGQWEYQVGPCTGIESGDDMWMSRYVLHRVAELHGVVVTFDPKPIPGDWNGSGCHMNFSTKTIREGKDAYKSVVLPMMEKLSKKHEEHIAVYGVGNERRLVRFLFPPFAFLFRGFAPTRRCTPCSCSVFRPCLQNRQLTPHPSQRALQTGKHETGSIEKFTYGVANRGCSVRIPNSLAETGNGYFEDRRPSSNCDPYVITSKLFHTTVLC